VDPATSYHSIYCGTPAADNPTTNNEDTIMGHDTLKLAEAAAAIGRLEKDKRNSHFGYDYLSEEAVKAAANRELTSRGLVPTEVLFEVLRDEQVQTKGGTANMVVVRVTIVVDGCRWQGLGAGSDSGDKAVMKAQTTALREAWKAGLIIASGHDPEADEATDTAPLAQAPRQQPQQREDSTSRAFPPKQAPQGQAKLPRITYTKLKNGEFGARIEGYDVPPEAGDIIEIVTKNGEVHQKRVEQVVFNRDGVQVCKVSRVDDAPRQQQASGDEPDGQEIPF
jgi:hypothetical protein